MHQHCQKTGQLSVKANRFNFTNQGFPTSKLQSGRAGEVLDHSALAYKMYSKTPLNATNKRPRENSGLHTPRKAQFGVVKIDDDICGEVKNFMFKILMPDGSTLELKMPESRNVIPIEDFVDSVRKEYFNAMKQSARESQKKINWKYQDLHFTANSTKISIQLNLFDFKCDTWHFLRLHDGSPEPDIYEGMWDLTPDTELLKELPDDYTFETALADLIDNSLQAVWSNHHTHTKLISVELDEDRIGIFDSGPGMDGTDGNLVKWGKMGASLHRSAREKAIGGQPPYLVPFFGMFGYGGPVATMCLGRRAVVSSKTRKCKKVFTLHLEREALISASHLENCWRVEIFEPKMKTVNIDHILCKLKDIYFPYIQCDEISGGTSTPVKFQVNGKDLAGIRRGEVATTNLHSCNGQNFVAQLHFSVKDQCKGVSLEANARLKFVYFPIIGEEESINGIINYLDADGYGNGESFDTFSRVSIRRLGRLLPDARWVSLPFMEPKQKIGEKAKILKRCCSRVICFVETDAGFNPTPHKTDLVQNHPYTKALKHFGGRGFGNDKDMVQVKISNDGKEVTLSRLEKLYFGWVSDMHENYDEEVDGGLDEPIIIVCSSKIEKFDLSSSGEARLVCRPLGLPDDRGCKITIDEMGEKNIEIGECVVFPIRVIDSEMFAQVDDTEWENKLNAYRQKLPSAIELLCDVDCQELGIEGGMIASVVKAGDALPENIVAVIRPKAFYSKGSLKRLDQKFISKYDGADMSLQVHFGSGVEMTRVLIYSLRVTPSSHKALNGLYIFSLRSKKPELFQKSGYYTLSFFLEKFKDVGFKKEIQVQACATACCWKVVSAKQDVPYIVRVGVTFDSPSIACFDKYGNIVKFASFPNVNVKVSSHDICLAHVCTVNGVLSTDKSSMTIKVTFKALLDFTYKQMPALRNFEICRALSFKLTSWIIFGQPTYEATICVSSTNEAFSVSLPCQVLPGKPHLITVLPHNIREHLIPGQVIEELALEVFDGYGNHAEKDERILLSVDGFSYEDRSGVLDDGGVTCLKKVDSEGIVDLSNILKVSSGYGKDVCLSVSSKDKVILKKNFITETRKLQTASQVFRNCKAGSSLDNIVFEIVDSEGIVDESVNHNEKCGRFHTIRIESDALDIDDSVQYTFRRGRCTIRSIPLPFAEGIFSFSAAHSRYRELYIDVEVHVENVRSGNQGDTETDEDSGHSITSAHNSCKGYSFLPQMPISKALNSTIDSFSPLTLTGNSLPTNVVYSPKTPEENSVRARQSDKAPKENAVPARQVSKNLGEKSGRAGNSSKTPKQNSVPANQSPKTLSKSAVPASCSPKLPKMLKANSVPANQSPKTLKQSAVSASQLSKTLKQSAVPSSCSPKTLKEDAATTINSPSQVLSHQVKEDWGAYGFREKDQGDVLVNCVMRVSDLEKRLKTIQFRLLDLQYVSNLQDHNRSIQCGKVLVQEKIESKSQSAGAIACKLIGETSSGLRPKGILGIVALLGAVETIELSRTLAQYLGGDLMRAVVCQSSAAAKSFQLEHGKSIIGGYYTFCLEDISPFNCEPSCNPDNFLPLPLPTNSNGYPPKGFRGYAVNMIHIEQSFSQWRTRAGHGLRETLFYRLFGKLHVYDQHSEMMDAQSCIEDGAVSLDGGIMRGNGLLSSGQWEPDVVFPVCDIEVLKLEQERDAVKNSLDSMRMEYSKALLGLQSIQSRNNV